MARDQRTIEAALLKKGFRQREKDHHRFFYYDKNERKSRVHTKTSHGGKGKTISNDLFGRMAKQVQLTNAQFMELVDCPMDRDAYENVLKKRGVL